MLDRLEKRGLPFTESLLELMQDPLHLPHPMLGRSWAPSALSRLSYRCVHLVL